MIEKDAEYIPIITPEEEEKMNNEALPDSLPILTLRNTVLFPGVVIPITVGRDKSIKLVEEAYEAKQPIGVISQKNSDVESPTKDDLFTVGTSAKIIKLLKMPDGNITIIIQGKRRFVLNEIIEEKPYLKGLCEPLVGKSKLPNDTMVEALVSSVKDLALQIIEQTPNIPTEASFALKNIESPMFLMNFIANNLNATVEAKQKILEQKTFEEVSSQLLESLTKEHQLLEIKNDIQSKVKTDLDKQQRDYFLQQQIKTIRDELGDSPSDNDVDDLNEKAKGKKWAKKVGKAFKKEVAKLARMNPQGAEYSVQLNYCQLLLNLPWEEYSKDNFDLKRAKKILDRDHYGMEKVKERILEYLAVLKLKGDLKAPILCLYGPPGVGKTSLGKSIAESIGREYVRMSLGGMRDEAEIRGHRKTYIGAMPGRVIQHIKKAGKSNPVFILDEIDKLARDGQGDPSSALLEVLDPEQNGTFADNYVELDYDLSKVMFVATANNLSTIQPALRDRMEIIDITGYTVEEKTEIAKKHLLPGLIKDHGIKKSDISVSKSVIEKIIEEYTRESGVRNLKQKMAKLIRHRAKQVAMDEEFLPKIDIKELKDIYGPSHARDKAIDNNHAGVVTGLAWTSVGGDILFIESSLNRGTGKLTLTGNLGNVMKESATIALQCLKANADNFGIDYRVFDKWDIHIHVPEGATPKDGPSAGITMITALVSLFTQRKIKKNLAMTGEITLRGKVLPVGGIKEKVLAAKRANITDIIMCESNRKDVEDFKPEYVKGVTFHYVNEVSEVIEAALLKQKVKSPKDINGPLTLSDKGK